MNCCSSHIERFATDAPWFTARGVDGMFAAMDGRVFSRELRNASLMGLALLFLACTSRERGSRQVGANCEEDVDCGSGHCNTGKGQCVECIVDAHCGNNAYCDDAECRQLGECATDEDCPKGQSCDEGEARCQRAPSRPGEATDDDPIEAGSKDEPTDGKANVPAKAGDAGSKNESTDGETDVAEDDEVMSSTDEDVSGIDGPPMADGGSDETDGTVTPVDDAGTPTAVEPAPTCTEGTPALMVLVSQAGSMLSSRFEFGSAPSPYGSHEDPWEAARAAVAALLDAGHAPLVRAFTGYAPQDGGECPVVEAFDDGLPANDALQTDRRRETPLAEALSVAYAELIAVTSGPKRLILVTNGSTDHCPPELINKGYWCGHDSAIAEVQKAYASSVQTSVVGLFNPAQDPDATDAANYLLNSLAHAGVGRTVQPPSTDVLFCIGRESEVLRGQTPTNDFYENWRPWAAATYASDGYTYSEMLHQVPADDVEGLLLELAGSPGASPSATCD